MPEDSKEKACPGLANTVLLPTIAGGGLGCLFVPVFGALAIYMGFSFFYLQLIPLIAVASFTFPAAFVTAIIFRISGKRVPWLRFIATIFILSALWVAFSVWRTPQSMFKRCFQFEQIPPSVVIHKMHHFQAGPDGLLWVHFSAGEDVMSTIIRTNNLALHAGVLNGDPIPCRLSVTPSWWKPDSLNDSHLYLCNHYHNPTLPPWSIGIWVNSASNEAFGFIR